jgi:hypothetical protein
LDKAGASLRRICIDPTTNIEGWNGKESWTFRTKKNAPSADLYHKIVVVETSPLCKG